MDVIRAFFMMCALVIGYLPSRFLLLFNPKLDMKYGRGIAELGLATQCGVWVLGFLLGVALTGFLVWVIHGGR